MRSPITRRIAGTGSRGCGPTKRWSSRLTSRSRRGAPGGPPTRRLMTPPFRPMRGRARASKSARSRFSELPDPPAAYSSPTGEAELSRSHLGKLGAAADALGQREGDLAGVVVDQELHRHAPPVEPNGVPGTAVDLVFNGGDRRAVDFYRRLLPAADSHLLDLARIGAHHRVGAEEVV